MKLLTLFISLSLSSFCQTYLKKSDSLNNKRFTLISATTVGGAASSLVLLNEMWYKGYDKVPLHSFNDANNWLQMDKVGHSYTAYHFSELISNGYKWSGVKPKKAAILGASEAFLYQFGIELLDGRSANWGFSWSDLLANFAGNALFVGQELTFNKQFFVLKYSYKESGLAQLRPNVLGSTFSEKVLKDYNAQTYWLSFSPQIFFPKSNFPKWLNLALGYSANNKLVGSENIYWSEIPTICDPFVAKRQYLLSLDINVKELPIKKKWLKKVLIPFHYIKVPFPSLILENSQLKGAWYN